MKYFAYDTAPYDEPGNFKVLESNSSCVNLEWTEPVFPNGIITNYTVSYYHQQHLDNFTWTGDQTVIKLCSTKPLWNTVFGTHAWPLLLSSCYQEL